MKKLIWQSYKQEAGRLVHFVRLANTSLKDEKSPRDNNVLACNFAQYSPILRILSLSDSTINRNSGSSPSCDCDCDCDSGNDGNERRSRRRLPSCLIGK